MSEGSFSKNNQHKNNENALRSFFEHFEEMRNSRNRRARFRKQRSERITSAGTPPPEYRGGRESNQVLERLGLTQDTFPRHEPALKLIQQHFPNFSWREIVVGRSRCLEFANYPYEHRGTGRPSIAEILRRIRPDILSQRS